MKKQPILMLATLALIVGLGSFFVTASLTNKSLELAGSSIDAAGKPLTHVILKDGMAVPNTVTIKIGETVQFNAADGKRHALSLGKGGQDHEHTGPYSSGEFGSGEAWQARFNKPGSYYFHDHNNPDINVLVVAYKDSAL